MVQLQKWLLVQLRINHLNRVATNEYRPSRLETSQSWFLCAREAAAGAYLQPMSSGQA
jgi:hypothetical protein